MTTAGPIPPVRLQRGAIGGAPDGRSRHSRIPRIAAAAYLSSLVSKREFLAAMAITYPLLAFKGSGATFTIVSGLLLLQRAALAPQGFCKSAEFSQNPGFVRF
jgi:hypothetical protein